MEKELAAKIYLLSSDDVTLAVLRIHQLLESSSEINIDEVVANYINFKDNPEQLAVVTTAQELSDKQAVEITSKVTQKFDGVTVVFEVDQTIIGGLVIRVGDNQVDESIATKIKLAV